jgi:hypothetical protein
MVSKREDVVVVPVKEQSEIFDTRRKKRRARINSAHAEIRAILRDARAEVAVSLSDVDKFNK